MDENPRIRVRVFTRSKESKQQQKRFETDKPIMKSWFMDSSLPYRFSYYETTLQSNYFRLAPPKE
jgi:hypothetical protein